MGPFTVVASESLPRDRVIVMNKKGVGPADPPPPQNLAELRLITAMRKIDPDMAAMIEALPRVYLVKK